MMSLNPGQTLGGDDTTINLPVEGTSMHIFYIFLLLSDIFETEKKLNTHVDFYSFFIIHPLYNYI